MLPTFVVIGAQKSGSTFLQACLADHPEIYMPAGEVSFFESPDYERSSLADLEALFAGRPERRLGFKRPNYLASPEVPERIARDLPDARLLAVLRNPMERAVSAYYHYIRDGFIPLLDPETGLRKILDDRAFRSRYPRSPEIIDFGFYHRSLLRYSRFTDSGRMLALLHDDVVSDPREVIRRAYRFLDVDPGYVPGTLHTRPQRVPYNLFRLRLSAIRSGIVHAHNADRTRLFRRAPSIPRLLASGALSGLDLVLERLLPNAKPVLSRELRQRLVAVYEDDVSALSAVIGRDLGGWLSRFA